MRTLLRALMVLGIVLALAATVAGVLVWQLPPWHGGVTFGDESIAITGADSLDGGHAVLGVAIATVAVIGALLLAAVAVVVGLGAALLGIAVALVAVAASLLLVASPLWLVAWLVWLLLRPRPAPPLVAGVGVGAGA